MRTKTLDKLFALSAIALATAGCGGLGSTTIPPTTGQSAAHRSHPPWWREAPATARAGVYVAQTNGAGDGLVFGYVAANRRNRTPSCSLNGQSFEQTQIAADRMGRLYLPESNGSIRIYAPHCGKLLRTVSDPGGFDIAVAVGRSKFYAAGGTHVSSCSMKACSNNLSDGSIFQISSLAEDRSGNVWAAYYNQSFAPSLIVWLGGSMPGHVVSGFVNPNAPGALLFDRQGTLLSIETIFPFVFLYSCDAQSASCSNSGSIQLHAASDFGALNAKNTAIQITDYADNAVDVYEYPSFMYKYSYDNGLNADYSVEGIAQTI